MSSLYISYKKKKFFIFLYGNIFFVQEVFLIFPLKNYNFIKKFWFFYILKIMYHFGLISLSNCIFNKLI